MEKRIFILAAGMMLVTYLPRVLPAVVLTKMSIPDLLMRWLRFVSVAVLGALLAPEILMKGSELDFTWQNLALLSAVPAFLVAIWRKSLFLTVFTGMLCMVVFTRLWG